MFKIGLSGQMFDAESIWDHLTAAAACGYETVELRSTHVKPGLPQETIEKIKAFLQKKGISVNALSCFTGNYGLLTDEEAEKAFETFKEYVALAVTLEAPMIRVWAAWQASAEADETVWERAAYWMKKSGEYAAEYGKKLVMEMHHGTLCDTADSSLRLLEMIGCDNVGLTLDPVNLYQVPENYTEKTIKKLGKHIFNVHIKDIIELQTGENPYCFEYGFYAGHIGRFTPVRYTPSETKRYFAHRLIGQGGVDWNGVIKALQDIGYAGALIVESVDEGNKYMPSGHNLAKQCIADVKNLLRAPRTNPNWHKVSVDMPGWYHVVSTKRDETQVAEMFRLNLPAGESYTVESGALEMNALVVKGAITIDGSGLKDTLNFTDSFYIPGGSTVVVTATEDCSLYIGAAPCDGLGKPLVRKMDKTLPIGDIHQIHGEGSGTREVMFTLAPQDAASRLICGVTWSGDGAWTSWKPHQHEKDLEEVYCYFDMDSYGLHYSYNTDEVFGQLEAYPVTDGSMVVAPNGYHPTCAIPGHKNVYFWVLAAHSHDSRSYELAVTDPRL